MARETAAAVPAAGVTRPASAATAAAPQAPAAANQVHAPPHAVPVTGALAGTTTATAAADLAATSLAPAVTVTSAVPDVAMTLVVPVVTVTPVVQGATVISELPRAAVTSVVPGVGRLAGRPRVRSAAEAAAARAARPARTAAMTATGQPGTAVTAPTADHPPDTGAGPAWAALAPPVEPETGRVGLRSAVMIAAQAPRASASIGVGRPRRGSATTSAGQARIALPARRTVVTSSVGAADTVIAATATGTTGPSAVRRDTERTGRGAMAASVTTDPDSGGRPAPSGPRPARVSAGADPNA